MTVHCVEVNARELQLRCEDRGVEQVLAQRNKALCSPFRALGESLKFLVVGCGDRDALDAVQRWLREGRSRDEKNLHRGQSSTKGWFARASTGNR